MKKIKLIAIIAVLGLCLMSFQAILADSSALRPTGAGNSTNLNRGGMNPAGSNWASVDEVTSDGDGSYVFTASNLGYTTDTYQTADSGMSSGAINSVTVYNKSRAPFGWGGENVKTVLRTHSTDYFGSVNSLTTNYTDYSTVYTTNPNTGNAWTWAEVDAMEIGTSLKGGGFIFAGLTTQVWAVIDYTP